MTAPVLEVRNLTTEYLLHAGTVAQMLSRGRGPAVRAVDDVSFTLAPGEVLGIVGESGCGKSTTGLTVLKLVEPTHGAIRFLGRDVTACRGRDLLAFRREAQIIFQDPYQSLNPRFTVFDTVAEPLVVHGLGRGARLQARVLEAIEQAGLRPPHLFLDRYPHELSGGQRQRVAIARAVVLRPKLLVADEPVSMLDVSVRAGILRLLRAFSRDAGISVIYISHDISTVRYLCDRTAVMYLGRIVEIGATHSVLFQPKHPYTRALLAAVPRLGHGRPRATISGEAPSTTVRPSGCVFHPRCPEALASCAHRVPRLLPMDDDHAVACQLYETRNETEQETSCASR